jgi:hypothetical protein
MAKDRRPEPVEPTDTISSVFTARRDLLHGIRAVVAGTGFTVEEADLLVSLFGARELDWEDLEHDKEGFVAFSQLGRYIVHSGSLLSRRIRKLAATRPPLLEVADVDPASGLHFNAKRVRITKEGVKRIGPVWEKYRWMSERLVEGIPQDLLKAHYEVNQRISAEIARRRAGLGDLLPDKT